MSKRVEGSDEIPPQKQLEDDDQENAMASIFPQRCVENNEVENISLENMSFGKNIKEEENGEIEMGVDNLNYQIQELYTDILEEENKDNNSIEREENILKSDHKKEENDIKKRDNGVLKEKLKV